MAPLRSLSPAYSSSESESEFEEVIPPKLTPAQAAAARASRASKRGTSTQAQALSDGELEGFIKRTSQRKHSILTLVLHRGTYG